MEFDFIKWRNKTRILDAANLYMKVIEEAGLSQNEALEVPMCLEGIIERSNYLSCDEAPFKAARVKIENDGNCGYALIDLDRADG